MKAPSGSAACLLLLAALLILPSCASFPRHATPLTPRSESPCDQAPPAPIPPLGNGNNAVAVFARLLVGLYHDEVTKYASRASCSAGVRAENQAAFDRAK